MHPGSRLQPPCSVGSALLEIFLKQCHPSLPLLLRAQNRTHLRLDWRRQELTFGAPTQAAESLVPRASLPWSLLGQGAQAHVHG